MTKTIIIAPFFSALPDSAVTDEQAFADLPENKITHTWAGEPASSKIATFFQAAWTREELIFRFHCVYTELDMDDPAAPCFSAARERYALWERDVCEAFIWSPAEAHEKAYREFEAAPNGQWCDLLVDRRTILRDWEWKSGMKLLSTIDEVAGVWRVVMKIPFTAFGIKPEKGDCWKANLFRITRLNGKREFLALSPTMTPRPNFHVPEAFVRLQFE